ncbi:hypothetical protein [Pseudonocardia sp. NPDC049635]|uniref:hypothetical protein n=1 Tax=Pseudonocardia sp. NPDC049635 TaxID=3155506 RepID=UPI00340FCC8D
MTEQADPFPEHQRPEVQALAIAALAKQIKAVDPVIRAMFAQDYSNGESKTFRAPDGRKLGQVRRNDPDPVWKITDRQTLDEWLRARGHVQTVRELAVPENHPELLAVLAEHAPHLLAERECVPEQAVAAALSESERTGEPVAPGIELVQQEGSLVVTVDRTTGIQAAADMARQGLVDWSKRPELQAGQ